MISITRSVSLWYRPCYQNMLNYDNNKTYTDAKFYCKSKPKSKATDSVGEGESAP